MELTDLLPVLRDAAAACGAGITLVGGCVRDGLLGRPLADIDLAVDGDCGAVAAAVGGRLGGSRFRLGRFGATRVASPAAAGGIRTLDFSPQQGGAVEDLARRDLTINALAVPLDGFSGDWAAAAVVDPFGGLTDLRRRSLKMVRPANFDHDPARLLRTVRLAAELGFEIDPATRAAIAGRAAKLCRVSPERVRDELVRLLVAGGAARWIAECEELGLLFAILPEMAAGQGLAQPKEHYWDVLTHQIETLAAVEALGGCLDPSERPHLRVVRWRRPGVAATVLGDAGSRTAAQLDRLVRLKLAALLHDVAKPATRTVQADGRVRFFGHCEVGAEVAAAALRRLRFSHADVQAVGVQVRYHLRPTQMGAEGPPSDRAVFRFFQDLGDAAIDTLLLSLADHAAARGPLLAEDAWARHVAMVEQVLTRHQKQSEVAGDTRLVTGEDLIALGLAPGPQIGAMLAELEAARAEGAVATREAALHLVGALVRAAGAAA